MKPKIPVSTARAVGQKHNLKQVILLTWDGEVTSVVTWGKSVEDCAQAAEGGNKMKTALGWPESLHAEPSRVKKLKARIAELEQQLGALGAFMKI